jgi:hypothetical protein
MAKDETRRKKSYKFVKKIFANEQLIKLAVVEAKTAERREMCGGGGGNSYRSDITAGKTIRILTPVPIVRIDDWLLRRPEDWLKVIALTYANTRELEREVMRKYYNGYKISELANEASPHYCGYAESTLFAILDRFQSLAVEIACQFGLIRVVDIA